MWNMLTQLWEQVFYWQYFQPWREIIKANTNPKVIGKVIFSFKIHKHDIYFCISSLLTHSIYFDNCYNNYNKFKITRR